MTALSYWNHPLGEVAARHCEAHRDAGRELRGGVACAACWARAIEDDAAFAAAFELDPEPPARDRTYVDWIAVERALAGDRVHLTRADRAALARHLQATGHTVTAIALRIGTSNAVVQRALAEDTGEKAA